MRRTLALWLLLFGVYAATIGLHAFGASDYAGDEPHYLLAAKSIVEDGDVDVSTSTGRGPIPSSTRSGSTGTASRPRDG